MMEDSAAPTANMKWREDESESDESSDEEFLTQMRQSASSLPAKVPAEVVKTKGELLMQDLPPVEDLHISVEPTELQKIGHILHILESQFLVVIESNGTANPLNEDSVLFLGSGEPLGKIHEPYGSVNRPNYVVRFNTLEDMHNKGLKVRQDVYYSPENDELTSYVLVDALKQQKGSDASWKDNNEPPVELIDYSDDEQETLANRKRRAKNRKNDKTWDSEKHVTPKRKESEPVNDNHERTSRANPSRNKFRSPTVPPTRSTYHSFSANSFGSTASSRISSHPSGPEKNALVGLQNSVPECFQRNVSSPQSRFNPYFNVTTPQPFAPLSQSQAPTPATFSQSQAATPPAFGHSSQSQGAFPHPFGHFSPSNVASHQFLTASQISNILTSAAPPSLSATNSQQQNSAPFSQSQAPTPAHFAPFSQSQAPTPAHFAPFSQSQAPTPPPIIHFSQSRAPTPPTFGHSSQSQGAFPHPFGHFSPSNVASHQFLTASQISNILTSAPPPSLSATNSQQQNSSSRHPSQVPAPNFERFCSHNLTSPSRLLGQPINALQQPQQSVSTAPPNNWTQPPPNYNTF